MAEYVDFENSSILEIGCGFGSFFKLGFNCKHYVGFDINENFINIAKQFYPTSRWHTSIPDSKEQFDICICSGVAGNQGGPAWNPSLLQKFLLDTYSRCTQKVLINFPTNRADIRSEHVEYFSPEYVLSQALHITHNVTLIHKHKFDFLLILEHD